MDFIDFRKMQEVAWELAAGRPAGADLAHFGPFWALFSPFWPNFLENKTCCGDSSQENHSSNQFKPFRVETIEQKIFLKKK